MPRKPNRSMKSHGFTIIPRKPNRGFRTTPRMPRHNKESHSFYEDDAPNSQAASVKTEGSRRVEDMQRKHRDIVSGHDRKRGVCEQSNPHEDSFDEDDDSTTYLPAASNMVLPPPNAGEEANR
ncbi:hypothetical protein PG988_012549 [Apiospora saccharicola]